MAIEDVPYFYAEQSAAAVAAGLHVYMAKPIAVDVPSCLAIGAAGKLATQKKLAFLVDYQLPTEPAVVEVAQRVRNGGLGSLASRVDWLRVSRLARSAPGTDNRGSVCGAMFGFPTRP